MDKPTPPPRRQFAPIVADKLTLALLQPELFEAINIPLRARRGQLRLVYQGHTPELWVRTPHAEPACIARLDTRTRLVRAQRPADDALLLMCADIERRLMDLDAALTLTYQPDGQNRKRVKLQLRHNRCRQIVMTLNQVHKGKASPWMGPFVLEHEAAAPEVAHG